MNHLLENYATIDSAVDTLCSAMAEKGYPNYIPTADTLWNVYSLVSAVNNGSVPYDPSADSCKGNKFQNKFQYGVKAEKVKHRKSRKSTRLEGTKHQGIWSGSAWRRFNNEWLRRAEEKANKKFKQNYQQFLYEGNEYLKELRGDYEDEDFYFADLTPEEEEEIRNFYPEREYWKEYCNQNQRETKTKQTELTEEEKAQKRGIILTALARKAVCDDENFFVTEKGAFAFVDVYDDPYDFDCERVGIALVKRESKHVRKVLLTFLHSKSSVEEVVEKVIEVI